MSVSVHGKIYKSSGISLEDIINVVKEIYDKNMTASLRKSSNSYRYSHVDFIDSNAKKEFQSRTLTIVEYENEPYIWMSLGKFGTAKDIIFNIVKQFGGEIDEDDCDDIGFIPVEKDAIEIPKVMEVTYKDICEKFGGIVKIK